MQIRVICATERGGGCGGSVDDALTHLDDEDAVVHRADSLLTRAGPERTAMRRGAPALSPRR